MTSRRWPTQRWPIDFPFVRRPSSRASAWGRCWQVPCPRCRSHADCDHVPPDSSVAPRAPAHVSTACTGKPGVVIVALTGRAPWLLMLGLVAVVLQPTMTTVWIWWLVSACAIGGDLLLALSPRRLVISREHVRQVRLGVSGSTTLRLSNPSTRPLRGIVRDAWQPSAGAVDDRHTVTLRGGHSVTLRTGLTPTRRGDRRADRVTVRSLGPLGRGSFARSRHSPRASTCPADLPSCASSTVVQRFVYGGPAPSSTPCATT